MASGSIGHSAPSCVATPSDIRVEKIGLKCKSRAKESRLKSDKPLSSCEPFATRTRGMDESLREELDGVMWCDESETVYQRV
jgi:hypothetical protein